MRKIIITSIILAAIFSAPLPVSLSTEAKAQVSDHYSVPLAIVRFNQPRVYFQRPVGNAIRSALQVSRDVNFNIINYIPSGNRLTNRRSEQNLQKVLQYIYSLGVRPQRVNVRKQVAAGLRHSEVHIYVR